MAFKARGSSNYASPCRCVPRAQTPPRPLHCRGEARWRHLTSDNIPVSYQAVWHATHDCVAPYVDIILHRGRFWAKSAASGSVRWCCFRSCWTVLSHVMRGRPSCLLQSARGVSQSWVINEVGIAHQHLRKCATEVDVSSSNRIDS